MDKNALKQKTDTSVQENHIISLSKDPTDSYQKQIQQCDIMINKHTRKYLVNIKPAAPKLNALIKT